MPAPPSLRLLIVETAAQAARPIQQTLREAGHAPVVLASREDALETASLGQLDLVIIDVESPDEMDWQLMESLKAQDPGRPCLLVTEGATLQKREITSSEVVSDFLVKPFAMAELIARVDALARRGREETALVLRAGPLWVDLAANELYRGTRRVHASPRELHLLKTLMREPRRVFSRDELCEAVWGRAHLAEMKLVEVSISRLRHKLGAPNLIHTVRKIGYTLGEPKL